MDAYAKKIGDLLSCSGLLRALVDIDPKHLQILYAFACQCVKRGEIKTAEQLFYQLFYLDSWHFDYLLSLGLCRQIRGAHQAALFCFARAGQVKVNDPRPAYYSALSYQKLGDIENAQCAFSSVLQCALNQPQYQTLAQKAEHALTELRS